MKRILLFTMAALMTASVSAQTVTAERSKMTHQSRVQASLVKKEMKQDATLLTIKEAPALRRAAVPAQKNIVAKLQRKGNFKVVNSAVLTAAARKVGRISGYGSGALSQKAAQDDEQYYRDRYQYHQYVF